MIIKPQQLLFDIVLFIYGLVAIIFATRTIWLTKKRLNEGFQFLLVAIVAWSVVKFLDILTDLRILSDFIVNLGELFFISLLIVGTWYINHIILTRRSKKK